MNAHKFPIQKSKFICLTVFKASFVSPKYIFWCERMIWMSSLAWTNYEINVYVVYTVHVHITAVLLFTIVSM